MSDDACEVRPLTIKVFLLDDHEIVRRGLRELLEATDDIEVIGESGLAQQAARRIPALRPDVAIFDARLPDGSGIDVCREVRSVDPTIKGLILTSFDDDNALATAVLAGASGYLLKDIKGNGLVEAIRRVAAGEDLLDHGPHAPAAGTLEPAAGRRPAAEAADAAGASDPRPRRRRPDQPPDRRDDVAGREDGEELRDVGARQAGHGASHAGRGVRRDPRLAGRPRRRPCGPRLSDRLGAGMPWATGPGAGTF